MAGRNQAQGKSTTHCLDESLQCQKSFAEVMFWFENFQNLAPQFLAPSRAQGIRNGNLWPSVCTFSYSLIRGPNLNLSGSNILAVLSAVSQSKTDTKILCLVPNGRS